jgi:cytochrome b561
MNNNTTAPKQTWKDNLQKTRFVMDTILLVSFLIVLAPQSTGIVLHEWLSLVFVVPFVIHILLHWQWFISSFKQLKRAKTIRERYNFLLNYTLYLLMIFVLVSGFLVSVALFPTLGIPLKIQDFWSKMHHDSATLIMPILGLHLALHFRWIKTLITQMKKKAA